jgi:hypothetical protein
MSDRPAVACSHTPVGTLKEGVGQPHEAPHEDAHEDVVERVPYYSPRCERCIPAEVARTRTRASAWHVHLSCMADVCPWNKSTGILAAWTVPRHRVATAAAADDALRSSARQIVARGGREILRAGLAGSG